jgi:hypothetical protein
MSNELGSLSDGAMVVNFEACGGVDGVGYDETETEPPSSTNPQRRSCFRVRSLRLYVSCLSVVFINFRNLGFCGHDLMRTLAATFNAPVPIYPEGPAFNMDAQGLVRV